ncbi:MAG: cbb3-type cytochrome c oxidase subunit 3 [Rugosibacter sp.]|nr:cbb3-type cytochrome c oxidase subunit 3 [Rugosibacter sp.]
MDINDLRSAITVLSFLVFIGIVWWAYSDRRKTDYEEAARLPLDDDYLLMPGTTGAVQESETQEKETS